MLEQGAGTIDHREPAGSDVVIDLVLHGLSAPIVLHDLGDALMADPEDLASIAS